jgi:hypothetical protein
MKPCLEDIELLQLMVADAGDSLDHREHLQECSRCAARFEEVARDTGRITSVLTHAADNLISHKRVAETFAEPQFADRFRLAAIFTGATALGGAAAFALLLTLGWGPAPPSNQLTRAGVNPISANEMAAIQRPAARSRVAAANDAAAAGSPGALYTAEAVTNDPLAGLAYGDSLSTADSNTNDDMLFCVPGEDGTICSSSADQG